MMKMYLFIIQTFFMQKRNYRMLAAITGICLLLFAFSIPKGGEGFEIYLNNKLVTQQFGTSMDHVKSFTLNAPAADDKLVVKYYHCGQIGKSRKITIRDNGDKKVAEWQFTSQELAMNIPVREINKKAGNTFKLYYTSTEIPKGRLLATLVIANGSYAKR
jgi:hypothetical protein